ncbi:uncharacterized protein [Anabrus simplex]|uniref:uncharacterized protein isoform X2 n=2 Tax=Anabrus simplex TaxID=316456 RepID=UPI0035A265DB
MDQNVKIKEEPVWLGGASTSVPSTDVKDELIKEEETVNQLVSCLKEENNEWKSLTSAHRNISVALEMDQNVKIKEEPVWLGGASTSVPSTDVKDELIKEEETVNQLVPCLKEENKMTMKEKACPP